MRHVVQRVVCAVRWRPASSVVCLGFLMAASLALFGTFYWNLWVFPTSWCSSKKRASVSSVKDSTGDDNFDGDPTEEDQNVTLQMDRFYRRPKPLQCNPLFLPYSIMESSHYCDWNTNLQACYRILQQKMDHSPTAWVFLGGADMSTLTDYVSRRWPFREDNVTLTTRRNACHNLLYYRFPPPAWHWKAPTVSLGEGPAGYGLEHPFCSDCRNCWNVLVEASLPREQLVTTRIGKDNMLLQSPSQQHYLEYLVVEYARDVTTPTSMTNTTQETVSYYLQRLQHPPQVCVVSVGLMDVTIPNVSQEIMLQNVDRYLSLLHRACDFVVWFSIPAVVEDDKVIPLHQNCQLKQWNAAIVEMLLIEKRYDNVYVIDIWEQSLISDHSGYLKLSNRFYASLARLFVAVMMGG